MKWLPIIVLLTACTPDGEDRSVLTATDGISVVILECFGWCALAEGDVEGQATFGTAETKAPFE